MVIGSLENTVRIETLHPLFRQLFDYVRTHDLRLQPTGRLSLEGEDLYINVDDAVLKSAQEQKLEVHRSYVDVHFPLNGVERIGWSERSALHIESEAPFDAERDFALYSCPASVYFDLHPGEFCIMYPEDAHAPIIGRGRLRKAIAKVRLEW